MHQADAVGVGHDGDRRHGHCVQHAGGGTVLLSNQLDGWGSEPNMDGKISHKFSSMACLPRFNSFPWYKHPEDLHRSRRIVEAHRAAPRGRHRRAAAATLAGARCRGETRHVRQRDT
eukprot:5757211-Pleurochrysis_carterae.AAC.2